MGRKSSSGTLNPSVQLFTQRCAQQVCPESESTDRLLLRIRKREGGTRKGMARTTLALSRELRVTGAQQKQRVWALLQPPPPEGVNINGVGITTYRGVTYKNEVHVAQRPHGRWSESPSDKVCMALKNLLYNWNHFHVFLTFLWSYFM